MSPVDRWGRSEVEIGKYEKYGLNIKYFNYKVKYSIINKLNFSLILFCSDFFSGPDLE